MPVGIALRGIVSGSGASVPAAPSSLSSSQAGDPVTISLSWTDNASNEDNYHVERSTDGSTWEEIEVLAANTTSHDDKP